MAIRYRKDRQRWQVYWKNPFTGKQESAFYASEKEAQKADSLIKHQLKFEKEKFRPADEELEPKEDDSLEAIYHSYLQEKRFGKKGLEWQLDGMRLPLELIGRKRISAITKQDLASVLRHQQEVRVVLAGGRVQTDRPVSMATVCGRMRVLYTVLRWALDRGFVDSLPSLPKLPTAEYEQLEPPTPEEVNRILRYASPHIQRVVIIGAKLGVRIGPSELFKMRWEHVDLERGIVRVQAAKKNRKEPWREVPIMGALLQQFREWRLEDKMLGMEYLIHYQGKPVQRIGSAWHQALMRAGIHRRIRPYDLRHAFATDALAAGQDVGTVAKLMGHRSAQMVLQHYQHVATEQKKEAVEALPAIDLGALQYAQHGMPKKEWAMLQ